MTYTLLAKSTLNCFMYFFIWNFLAIKFIAYQITINHNIIDDSKNSYLEIVLL